MSEETIDEKKESISYYQGSDAIKSDDPLMAIKQKISELSNLKNLTHLQPGSSQKVHFRFKNRW